MENDEFSFSLNKPQWSLPDFGEPITRRDRSAFPEPALGHHYSDTEDDDEHKRRDFVHSNAAHFSRISVVTDKKKKKVKKEKTSDKSRDRSGGKLENRVGSIVNEVHKEEDEDAAVVDENVLHQSTDPLPSQISHPQKVTIIEDTEHHASQPHGHHKHVRKKLRFQDRRRTGDQIEEKAYDDPHDDNEGLTNADIDTQHSHRLDDVPGIRKHIIHRPMKKRVKLSSRNANVTLKGENVDVLEVGVVPKNEKVNKNRQTHEVFVELDELEVGQDNHLIWKERARWIKFEEDVEDNDRWSKPHIASLSFLSLWEVRKGMEKGLVLLDLDSYTLPGIAGEVVTAMAKGQLIRDEDRIPIMNTLLLKHESDRKLEGKNDWTHILDSFHKPEEIETDTKELTENLFSTDELQTISTAHFLTRENSITDPKNRPKIMNRIPDDSEASIVLVGKTHFLEHPVMAFVRLSEARDLGEVLSVPIPVRFIFILLGPDDSVMDYHEIGRSISTLMSNVDFHNRAYLATTKRELLKAIKYFLDDAIVLPPGQLEDPNLLASIKTFQNDVARKKLALEMKQMESGKEEINPLARTRKIFGAMWNDVKRRYTLYRSDITDGLNTQCMAAAVFLYFAVLSPAITFGGLLGDKTKDAMGVSETLMGSAVSGIIGALFLGQPLLILGMTGPNVVFEEALYNFCTSQEVNFLSTRVWTGFWILLISIIFAIFEGSALISKFTRFTEEIFSTLISLIFIVETFKKLAKTFAEHPMQSLHDQTVDCIKTNRSMNESEPLSLDQVFAGKTDVNITELDDLLIYCGNRPNTALLSTLLCLGCFALAMALRKFRGSNFLRSSARRLIGDFGVPIAIMVFVLIDYLSGDVYTEKLLVPDAIAQGALRPTDISQRGSGGGWVINPIDPYTREDGVKVPFKYWIIAASFPFALLCFILLFIESQLAELIISGADRKLKKGVSYHLNMFIIGITNGMLSLFGCPWICAASVRTLTHINAVTIMSKNNAPGEKQKIVGAKEQRLTGFLSHLLLGLSVLLGSVLQEVPTSVLFGIFLYMGIVSLNGLQLFDRIILLFMPSKHHPGYRYIRKVKPVRIHLFTLIQIACIGVLWAVKSTAIAIAFPFFLVLCVPCRIYLLPYIFTNRELTEIDNETLEDVYDDHDDAYAESHAVPSQFNLIGEIKQD